MNAADRKWLNEQMANVARALYPPPPTMEQALERLVLLETLAHSFSNPNSWARKAVQVIV